MNMLSLLLMDVINLVVSNGKNYYDSESSDDSDEDQVLLYTVYLVFTSVNYQMSYFYPI